MQQIFLKSLKVLISAWFKSRYYFSHIILHITFKTRIIRQNMIFIHFFLFVDFFIHFNIDIYIFFYLYHFILRCEFHYSNVATRTYNFTTDKVYPRLFIFMLLMGYRLVWCIYFCFKCLGISVCTSMMHYLNCRHLYLFPMLFKSQTFRAIEMRLSFYIMIDVIYDRRLHEN